MTVTHADLPAPEALVPHKPPMLLLDEVSAHLDAGRRAALYDEIVALGAQAFLTGTGPELFTDLGDRAMHIEVRDEAGQSLIQEIAP